jgi:NitT/TauT family transport system permease protein
MSDITEQIAGTSEAAVAPLTRRRNAPNVVQIVGPIAIAALVVTLWEYMHRSGMRRFFDKPGFLLPSPVTVIHDSFLNHKTLSNMLLGLKWTAVVALVGLCMSIVLGMGLALVMAQARWVERSVYPYLVALQAIPVLSVVPLILSVFGGGLNARLFVCVMISIFPIVSNTLFGLLSVDQMQHDLFTLQGVSKWTRLRKLQLPAAMPAVFTGFRISAGLSVIGAVVGEQFFRKGSKPGIGIIMEQYRQNGLYPRVYGGLMVACLLGIVVFFLFGLIGRLVVGHWHESTR